MFSSNKKKADSKKNLGSLPSHKSEQWEELIKHLSNVPEDSFLKKKRNARIWLKPFREFCLKIHQKGCQKLIFMLVPHSARRILNLRLSIYSLVLASFLLVSIILLSIISLIGKSGEDVQFYEMGLTNRQFNLQSVEMAEQMIILHQWIKSYTNTIADLYLKLDGDESETENQGREARIVVKTEIKKLKALVEKCQQAGANCPREDSEEIFRRVIFLSRQDNHDMQKSIEFSEQILKELASEGKKSLLENTPTIWPANGFLLSPFGLQADLLEGREIFRRGIQIGALPGTNVYASAPGKVQDVSYGNQYGLTITLSHLYGITTFYAHLNRVNVQKGDRVSKGEIIGHVGNTGIAPVYMLYYEVHVGTVAYNPHSFLNRLQDLWLLPPKT